MQFQPAQPTTKGPAELFTGDVHFDVIARGEAPSRLRVNLVRFAPGARTAWHRHSLGQTLHVTDGIGLVQAAWRRAARDATGRHRVHAPGGVALARGHPPIPSMCHLAMWEDDDATWGDHVTDEEYGATPVDRRG